MKPEKINMDLGGQAVANSQDLSEKRLNIIKQQLANDLKKTEEVKEADYNLCKVVPDLLERLALLKDICNFFNHDLDRPIHPNLIRREDLEIYLFIQPRNDVNTRESLTDAENSISKTNNLKANIGSKVVGIISASFIELVLFVLTSFSLATLNYSSQQLIQQKPEQANSFVSQFQESSRQVFWITICVGSTIIIVLAGGSGILFLFAILSYPISYLWSKFDEEVD